MICVPRETARKRVCERLTARKSTSRAFGKNVFKSPKFYFFHGKCLKIRFFNLNWQPYAAGISEKMAGPSWRDSAVCPAASSSKFFLPLVSFFYFITAGFLMARACETNYAWLVGLMM